MTYNPDNHSWNDGWYPDEEYSIPEDIDIATQREIYKQAAKIVRNLLN